MKILKDFFRKDETPGLNLPQWFWLVLFVMLALGIIGAWGYLKEHDKLGQAMSLLVLTLTLIAVSIYTYYNYLHVRDIYTPVGTFYMRQADDDRYHILTFFSNQSRQSIRMWAELKATVYGQVVNIGGFYSTAHPWELLPFTQGQGHFGIPEILQKVSYTVERLKQTANERPHEVKHQLRFTARIWYQGLKTPLEIHCPIQNYYFDFTRDVLVLDV